MTSPATIETAGSSSSGLLHRLAGCRKGVAAVEFGYIVPIMFMLFVGTVEFSQAITVDRRVTQVASSIADLIGREKTLTTTEMEGRMGIITSLLKPYSATPLKLTVLNVYIAAATTDPKICWHYHHPQGGTGSFTNGSSYSGMPTGILDAGSSVIVADVKYDYTPLIFNYFIQTGFPMTEKFYVKPRLSASVQFDGTQCL